MYYYCTKALTYNLVLLSCCPISSHVPVGKALYQLVQQLTHYKYYLILEVYHTTRQLLRRSHLTSVLAHQISLDLFRRSNASSQSSIPPSFNCLLIFLLCFSLFGTFPSSSTTRFFELNASLQRSSEVHRYLSGDTGKAVLVHTLNLDH